MYLDLLSIWQLHRYEINFASKCHFRKFSYPISTTAVFVALTIHIFIALYIYKGHIIFEVEAEVVGKVVGDSIASLAGCKSIEFDTVVSEGCRM